VNLKKAEMAKRKKYKKLERPHHPPLHKDGE